jgi:acyl-CoA thioesterase-1
MCKIKWLKIVWVAFAALLMVSCGGNVAKENKDAAAGGVEEVAGKKAPTKKYIIFFGNSLTAGYGIEPGEAFPALIQQRIDSLGLNYTVVNAGLSGETTAAGLSRVDWVIGQQPVDIFILELGGNDGLRGIEVAETKKNLTAIIKKVWAKHPNAAIILAGMMIPPNMGATYSNAFKAVFPAVAAETNVKLIPFILENVGGEKELNLEDGIHPTPEGHKLVRENVWAVLKDVVE